MAASSREQQPSVVNDISMQIRSIDPKKHDPNVIKALHNTLLRVKNEEGDRVGGGDSFIHCLLCIQSVSNEISDLRFRVKLFWTGIEVKTEIRRLYEIPTNYQVLIVNRRVISDHETLENCHFQHKNQIVYITLTKIRIRYQNSGIRLRDFLPKRNDDITTEGEEGVSQMLLDDPMKLTSQDRGLLRHEHGASNLVETEFGNMETRNDSDTEDLTRLHADAAISFPPETKASAKKGKNSNKKKRKKRR